MIYTINCWLHIIHCSTIIEHLNNNITNYVPPQLNQAKSSTTTPAIRKKQGIETMEKGGTTNGRNKVRKKSIKRCS
jgi:hypothetical protein